MGGEGAMMHANQSLKANRKLVGKRRETRFSFVHTSDEKTEYNLPKSTPETLKRIQEKIKNENKLRNRKRFGVLAFVLVLLVTVLIYLN